MAVKKTVEELPIEFCWATFCKGVLEKGNERTIYSVMPSVRADIVVGGGEAGEEGAPDRIRIPFPELALYALFKRREGVTGEVKVPIQLEVNNEALGSLDKPELLVILTDKHSHSQQIVNFRQAGFDVPNRAGTHEMKFKISFRSGNNKIGHADFPIHVTITHQPVNSVV